MATISPTEDQALAAKLRIEPFLGLYSSAWSRQTLFSTLHHTSGVFDRFALGSEQFGDWLETERWPGVGRREIYHFDHLRWCENCLRTGYHFFGQQLVGLARCPLHSTPIKTGCPRCGVPLLFRSRHGPKYREPLRDCLHCGGPILDIKNCSQWPKSDEFKRNELASLRRFAHWAKRVEKLHYSEYSHPLNCFSFRGRVSASAEDRRLAIEAVCPLPRSIVTRENCEHTVVTVVVLDARMVQKPVVTERCVARLWVSILRHMARKALPLAWVRHWRTGELELPAPAVAGESSHFHLWKYSIVNAYIGIVPTGPREVIRPCMMPLLAKRIISQFGDFARGEGDPKKQDLRVSFFFSTLEAARARKRLGEMPGIIVELHKCCEYKVSQSGRDKPAVSRLVAER